MELGISTACFFQKIMIEDAILNISAHGVKRCELFLNTFSEYEPGFIELLKERLVAANIDAYSVHPMSTQYEPQLFSIHPRQRRDALALYERVLQGAKMLGVKVYVMHGPVHLSGAAKNISLSRLAPIFQELSDMAASYGVMLALENVSWCVFCTAAFGRSLRERMGAGVLKYTLDIKQAMRYGQDPLEFVEAVGPDIVNVHLCDAILGQDGDLDLRLPGYGAFDFAALKGALKRQNAQYEAFIEVYSDMYEHTGELYESYARMHSIFS